MPAPLLVVAVHDTAPEHRALAEGAVMQIACLLHAAGAQIYAPHPASLGDDPREWPAQLPGTTGAFLGEGEAPDPLAGNLLAVRLGKHEARWCMRTSLFDHQGGPGSVVSTRGAQDAVVRGIVRTVRGLHTRFSLNLPPRFPLQRYLERQLGAHTTGQVIARLVANGEVLLGRTGARAEGDGSTSSEPPALH